MYFSTTLRVDLPEIVEIHTHMKVIKPNVSSFWLIIDLETDISMNIFGALHVSLYIYKHFLSCHSPPSPQTFFVQTIFTVNSSLSLEIMIV